MRRYLSLTVYGFCLAILPLRAGTAAPEPPPAQLICNSRQTATVFDLWQMSVAFPKEIHLFAKLPDTQFHDAYDADRNGVFLQTVYPIDHVA